MELSRVTLPETRPQIRTRQEAEDLAARVVPARAYGVDSHHYLSLARRLIAAAAWHAADTAGGTASLADVRRIVETELPAGTTDVAVRPLSRSTQEWVRETAAAVRDQGRPWVAADPAGPNAAAWVALHSLDRAGVTGTPAP